MKKTGVGAKPKTNLQLKGAVQKNKPNKTPSAKAATKNVEVNIKMTKKDNVPLKKTAANGKVAKKEVVPLAEPVAQKLVAKNGVANGKVGKKEIIPLIKPAAQNVVNDKVAKKNVSQAKALSKNVAATGKTSKKSAILAKVVPSKKMIRKEESDDDDENSDEEQAIDSADDIDSDDDGNDIDEFELNSDDDEEDVESSLIDDEAEEDNDSVDEDIDVNDDAAESDNDGPAAKDSTLKKKGLPLINLQSLPKDTPNNQIIHIKNLPKIKTYTHEDIAEVFFKYGTILSIVIFPGADASTAFVAYNTAAAAQAALKEDKKAKVKNCIIEVSLRNPNKKDTNVEENKTKKDNYYLDAIKRTIYVGNINESTQDDLKAHFKSCGSIEKIFIHKNPHNAHAFVEFEKEEAVVEGLKLSGSELNGSTIYVKPKGNRLRTDIQDPELTVVLMNTNKLPFYEESKIRKIFSKCGNIKHIDLVCLSKVLAFVTFENQSEAQKALKLNGKNVGDLHIEVEPYKKLSANKQTIVIQNVQDIATNDDITEHFKSVGPIVSIQRKNKTAIVKFETTDAFCKSFLLDDSFLCGKPIFISPFSIKRDKYLKNLKSHYPFKPNDAAKRPHFEKKYQGQRFNKTDGPPNKRAKKFA